MARRNGRLPSKIGTFGPVKKTRYPELNYQHRIDHWRLIDTSSGDLESGVGPAYSTERELLADLDRYAANFGC